MFGLLGRKGGARTKQFPGLQRRGEDAQQAEREPLAAQVPKEKKNRLKAQVEELKYVVQIKLEAILKVINATEAQWEMFTVVEVTHAGVRRTV